MYFACSRASIELQVHGLKRLVSAKYRLLANQEHTRHVLQSAALHRLHAYKLLHGGP